MANMRMDKNPMPEQDPVVRAGNFDEVALGYTPEMAMDEAKRCLNCHNTPCRTGCPVSVRIPEFIAKVAEGDFDAAYEIITSTNSLPAVCGRVCPQEKQCESKCVRGIKGESVGIGRLERFVADYHMNKAEKVAPVAPESNGHKVAVVGSGPSSLTCAGDLRKLGYEVTIFEAFHKAGGVLVYGIPQFRRIPFCGGEMAYALSIVRQLCGHIGRNVTFTIDGEELTVDCLMCAVCNGRTYGGGFYAAPEAQPDDGWLDVFIIRRVSRLTIARLLGMYKSGRHFRNGELTEQAKPYFIYRLAKCVSLRPADGRGPIVATADGECAPCDAITAQLKPLAGRVLLPKPAYERFMAQRANV